MLHFRQVNKQKCIEKKIKASQCPDFTVNQNEVGKCITIQLSTAAYELFKTELKSTYKKEIRQGIAEISEGIDTVNNLVDMNLRYKDEKDCTYTVNLYNTTCAAMINGKDYKVFLPIATKIADKLLTMPTQDLNAKVRIKLQKALAQLNSQQHSLPKHDESENQSEVTVPLALENQECRRRSKRAVCTKTPWDPTDLDEPESGEECSAPKAPSCILCEATVETLELGMECTECGVWVHENL